MEYYVGILAATILVIASNAGIFGVSRLTYSMGQYQQLPDRLRRISPRFRTPAIAIVRLRRDRLHRDDSRARPTSSRTLYAFGAMLSFTIAHVSLIGLRWRLARSRCASCPATSRSSTRKPGTGRRSTCACSGVDVPLFAVIGGLGTLAAWIAVMGLYTTTLFVGTGWMAVGIVSYYVYRRRKGLSLTETSKVMMPPALGAEPVRYAAVLVAFEEGTYSEDAMATALKLAVAQGRGRAGDRDDHGATAPRHRCAAAGGRGDRAGGDRDGAPVGRQGPAGARAGS